MDSEFRKTVSVSRRSVSYVNGKPVFGAPFAFTIEASVQPIKLSDMERLPEGRRSQRAFRLYTDSTLQTLVEGQSNPDVVTIYGEAYEVLAVDSWQNDIISHNKYIVGRVQP